MSTKILITGATGNIAGHLIPQLIKAGSTVHALVRDTAKASNLEKMGVKLFVGDFENAEAIKIAAEGVDSVLAITPANPNAVAQGEVILNAVRSVGSPRYLRLSAIGAAEDAPTANGRFHYESDKALIESGLTYTILRPHFYMQNVMMNIGSIVAEGNFYLGMGDGSLGMIDVRDIADCFAAILINGGHENKIYTPTGPASITFHKIAEIITKGIGKQVNYVAVPYEAVGKAIIDAGWGEWLADVMMDYSKAYAEGWGDFTNNEVQEITGNKARSFDQFFSEIMAGAMSQTV